MTKLILLFITLPLFSSVWQQKPSLLDKRLSITFYKAEILESVVNRIGVDTGETIIFDVRQLLPYKAKADTYRNATVKEILDDQLAGTPFKYRINRKKQLEVYIVSFSVNNGSAYIN
jgi:hypothetical protein